MEIPWEQAARAFNRQGFVEERTDNDVAFHKDEQLVFLAVPPDGLISLELVHRVMQETVDIGSLTQNDFDKVWVLIRNGV